MTEINFQPVFDYLDEKLESHKEEIMTAVRAELYDIKTNLANLAGEVKDFREEMKISNFRTTRLEEWAVPVGNKLNLPIEF